MTDLPPPAPPAATVLLLRDGPQGLEVLMVGRNREMSFRGAMVFPGGKVDAADSDPRLRPHVHGAAGIPEAEIAHQVAAIREAFEESGVLLARPRGSDALIPAERTEALLALYRQSMAESAAFVDLVVSEMLDLALDRLVPFAHWIAPSFAPARFDTRFYLAPVPAEHRVQHDGQESMHATWVRPLAAIADAEAGRCTIVFPTRMQLGKLGRSATVTEALQRATTEPMVTVYPVKIETPEGPALKIPAEANYPLTEILIKDLPRAR